MEDFENVEELDFGEVSSEARERLDAFLGGGGEYGEYGGSGTQDCEGPARFTDIDETEYRLEAYPYPRSAWPMLTMELLGTDYEFGRLKLEYPVRDTDLNPAMRLLSRRRWMDWRQSETLDVVVDDERGMVIVALYRPWNRSEETLRSVYWSTKRVEFELEMAMFEAGDVDFGGLPVHTAVVAPEGLDEEDREEDLEEAVPAADVILPEELPRLEERLDELFAYRVDGADTADAGDVEQMIRLLKASDSGVGEFQGHQQCVDAFVEKERKRVTSRFHSSFEDVPF